MKRRNKLIRLLGAAGFIWVVGCSHTTAPTMTTRITLSPTQTPILETFIPPSTTTPSLSPVPTATQSGEVTLIALGDLMLGRSVGEQILEKGPQVVFAQVQSVLDGADLRVGNLECALTDTGTPEKKSFTLEAPPEAAKALASGKIDLVSLANNHAMDFGYEGLARSQELLEQAGVASAGAGVDFTAAHTPVILTRNGLKVAFLAYVDVPEELGGYDVREWAATESMPGVAWADPAQITADVTAAKANADVVVVLLHAGIEIGEYMSTITPAQRDEAKAAIDAGAALVVGSHPHELQSIERYHDGLIAYSLGNFVFDEYLGIANASVILRVKLNRQGFVDYDYVPVLIDNGLPHVITPDLAPAIGTLVAP